MNEVVVNRETMRRVGAWCPAEASGQTGDEEFWTMTAAVVPRVIRASSLDPARGDGTGPLPFQPTPGAGPAPAPAESEQPSSGDREPPTGTATVEGR